MAEIVELTSERLLELRRYHDELSRKINTAVDETHGLRTELLSAIEESDRSVRRSLARLPGVPSSHYWGVFGEYWHSFELFSEKMQIACQQLSAPFFLDENLLRQPESLHEDAWEDAVDEVEEAYQALKMRKTCRTNLLTVIELIDSTQRLVALNFPSAKGKGKAFVERLQSLQGMIKKTQDQLWDLLEEQGVTHVDLSVGQYPPPETTRIISRLDANTDDHVVIAEIVLDGYLWQEKLLRKADVIVTSRRGD